ncbi:hypothetical protein AK812_SmicGene4067 [Symbiodinium microadriaticum]|uniref:Uncharacterized protein n=1 Tax=Symbiodinium microadriaticum TaxID=2951 RepID=A0A1Q9EXK5_SYMMI|nr:hypothetical protein AK812_SmicGene4067 [Symbiodinium microadriaticum]
MGWPVSNGEELPAWAPPRIREKLPLSALTDGRVRLESCLAGGTDEDEMAGAGFGDLVDSQVGPEYMQVPGEPFAFYHKVMFPDTKPTGIRMSACLNAMEAEDEVVVFIHGSKTDKYNPRYDQVPNGFLHYLRPKSRMPGLRFDVTSEIGLLTYNEVASMRKVTNPFILVALELSGQLPALPTNTGLAKVPGGCSLIWSKAEFNPDKAEDGLPPPQLEATWGWPMFPLRSEEQTIYAVGKNPRASKRTPIATGRFIEALVDEQTNAMLNPEKWQQDFDMPSRLPNLYMKSNKPFTPTLFKKGFPEKRVKWINMKIGEIPDALFLEDQKMIKRLEDELSVLGTFDEVKAFFKKHEDDMKTKEGGGDTDIKSITVLSARSGKLRIQTAAPFPPQYNKRPCPFADLVQTDPDPQAIAISLPQKMEAGATYDCLCYLEEDRDLHAGEVMRRTSRKGRRDILAVYVRYLLLTVLEWHVRVQHDRDEPEWQQAAAFQMPLDLRKAMLAREVTMSDQARTAVDERDLWDVSLPDNGGARGNLIKFGLNTGEPVLCGRQRPRAARARRMWRALRAAVLFCLGSICYALLGTVDIK